MKLTTVAWTAAATAVTAAVGGAATDPDGTWYLHLRKPDWQPPAIAFPIVWTALYADLAVSSAAALARWNAAGNQDPDGPARNRELHAYRRAFAVNLVLNAAWSWLFWRTRRPPLAAAEAAMLAVSSADLVRRTYRLNRTAGITLAPYAAWCGFATVLSAAITRLNAGQPS